MELLVVEFVSLNRDGFQAPPFSCSPNGHSLFFCWVCHSVLSIVNYWLIICVHEGECHHAEKKSFMLVSWKNGTMENAKAAYFWLQNSHALLELLGTTYMHMIPCILCLLLISPHLAPSRELEDREELEMLSKNAPGMQHAIFLLGKGLWKPGLCDQILLENAVYISWPYRVKIKMHTGIWKDWESSVVKNTVSVQSFPLFLITTFLFFFFLNSITLTKPLQTYCYSELPLGTW